MIYNLHAHMQTKLKATKQQPSKRTTKEENKQICQRRIRNNKEADIKKTKQTNYYTTYVQKAAAIQQQLPITTSRHQLQSHSSTLPHYCHHCLHYQLRQWRQWQRLVQYVLVVQQDCLVVMVAARAGS